jgi:hypothetical protein
MNYIKSLLGDIVSDGNRETFPLWKALTEFKNTLINPEDDEFTIEDAISWVRETYPKKSWADGSFEQHLPMMSTNNKTRANTRKIREDYNVFFRLGSGRYRPYYPGKDLEPIMKSSKSIPTKKSPSPIVNAEYIIDVINRRKLVILEGVPGTGKTHIYKSIKKDFEYATFLTFHPSSDYSTFVGGIRPGKDETTGKLVFNPTKGHLLNILDNAKDGSVLLWIDELNRANVPRVFGDLISLIGNKKPPDLHIPNVGLEEEENLSLLPEQIQNLHIVATMNTSDRSVTPLDAALRRRFNFIRLHPMGEEDLFKTDLKDDFLKIKDDITCFEQLNKCLNENMGTDAMMGHSYLFEMSKFADDDSKRKLLWKFSILPNIIDTLLISQNFELINEINPIIKNNTGLKLVDSARDGVGKGLGRMILVKGVSE